MLRFSTRALHVGQQPDATGAVVPALYQASTYLFDGIGQPRQFEYSRIGNPTRQAYEECLASLEDGTHGFAFASGMAAEHAVISLLGVGDHVVCGQEIYGGTTRLFNQQMTRIGLEFTYADATNLEIIDAALTDKTRMLWLESPTNPLLTIVDLAALSQVAHSHPNVLVVVDNTFASPCFQNPLNLGADLVVHSATKYIGGHSDLVGGAVVVRDDALARRIRFLQSAIGAVQGPFDCWLALRGLKTLAVRMKQHETNALAVASFLNDHPKVERVYFPGLPSHPGYDLARQQMTGFGAMMSLEVKGGLESARKVVDNVKLFLFAESLGGVESLLGHPATMSHASVPKTVREASGITDSLLRLSVGIEDVEDLIADLDQALASL